MNDHTRDSHLDDPALRDLARRLDHLGAADRGWPDAGFEARLARSTRPGVAGVIGPGRSSGLWASWWSLPIAACAALGIVGFWLARSAPPPAAEPTVLLASLESDIEDFLFIDGLPDERAVVPGTLDFETDEERTADEWLYELLRDEGGES